jgi:single-strand selective monofunctional uracil DNA glycosylase
MILSPTSKALIDAADELRSELRNLSFSEPVSHTYHPLDYAWEAHCSYLANYGSSTKKVLFLGMNPGPFGMTQTGIPFGEIAAVRDWMKIECAIQQPEKIHPKRPIEGFQCQKSEVSGKRLWGLFSSIYPNANDFFQHHFVANYCPLVWMSATGANITPDKIHTSEIKHVEASCLKHLKKLIAILQPKFLIGVGAYAEQRMQQTSINKSDKVGKILHPSPASPAANRDWVGTATKQLKDLGVW